MTGVKVGFWKCPVRGLAVQFQSPPQTTYVYDQGTISRLMHFSRLEDETQAKRDLILDVVLGGIDLYRGLPNQMFDEQVGIIRALLNAPPSFSGEEWLALKAKLDPKIQPLLTTHEADLRQNILGEKFGPGRDVGRVSQ
jgi:hypothetical protein